MTRKPLAPHVQAAISAAQPRMAGAPARPAPAPHVQSALSRTVQPRPAAPEPRRPAPHVQAALTSTAQPRTAPLQPRHPAPHVQAAVVQPRLAVSEPPRQVAAHVQASVAAIQPKVQGGVIQPVKFRVFFKDKGEVRGKYQVIDSEDIVKDSSKYTSGSALLKILKAISEGEEFEGLSDGTDKRRKYGTRTPTNQEKEEADEALKALGTQKGMQKKIRGKEKRDKEKIRLEEVGETVEKWFKEIKDDEYKKGKLLSDLGEKSLLWSLDKYKETTDFQINVKQIEKQTGTTMVMEGETPFRHIETLLESRTKTDVLNLGGQNVWVVKTGGNGKPSPPNVQVNLGQGSAYHKMSLKPTVVDDLGHKQLNVLERARDRKSATSEYIKEDLYRKNRITSKERFSDTLKTTYQEFKKDTRDSYPNEVERIQISSSYFNLDLAVDKLGDNPFGVPVVDKKRSTKKKTVYRPRTTPTSLKRKLSDYLDPNKQEKDTHLRKKQKVGLRKEVSRLNRSMIEEDYSSEEENDVSDTEMAF